MGCTFLSNAGNIVTFNPATGLMAGNFDDERGIQYAPAYDWNYKLHNAQTTFEQNNYTSRWTKSSFYDPGGAFRMSPIFATDVMDSYSGSWEPWSVDGVGGARLTYLSGTVIDQTNNPVVGATINAFITATNVLDGTTVTGAAGVYSCPCNFPAVAHFTTAYYASYQGGSDIAGESANNLIPV